MTIVWPGVFVSLDTMAMCRPPCSQAVTAYLVCLHVLGQSPDQGGVASCPCSYTIGMLDIGFFIRTLHPICNLLSGCDFHS